MVRERVQEDSDRKKGSFTTSPPLAQERKTVLYEYFRDFKVEPIHEDDGWKKPAFPLVPKVMAHLSTPPFSTSLGILLRASCLPQLA